VQPITWSRRRDYPAPLAKNKRHRKVAALSRVTYPFFAVLLGCMRWLLRAELFLGTPTCAAEHLSCCWKKTLKLFDPPQAESFLTPQHQREAQGNPKERDSRGALFLLLLLSAYETADD